MATTDSGSEALGRNGSKREPEAGSYAIISWAFHGLGFLHTSRLSAWQEVQ